MTDQTNCVGCDESPGCITMSGSVLVSKMFQETTGLKVKSNYTLCKACQQELRSCYNFRKRCLEIFSLYNSSSTEQSHNLSSHDDLNDKIIFANPLTTEIALIKTEDDHQIPAVEFANDDNDDTMNDDDFSAYNDDSSSNHVQYEEINPPESSDDENAADSTQDDPDYDEKSAQFECESCSKSFNKRSHLVAHMATHRNHRFFVCPRDGCTSAFSISHRLLRHLRNVHNADEDEVEDIREKNKAMRPPKPLTPKAEVPAGKVQCTVCMKILANKRYLKEHMELQHLSTAKYKCTHDGCKKRFKIWSLYEMHMKKHNGQCDFICKFCGKGYVQRKIFNSHMRKSHQVSQDEIDKLRWSVNGTECKDNKCRECNLEFKAPHKLFEHRALIHGDGKKFICDICGKAFFSKAFLLSHQKYHKGVKNRKCVKCPSSFTEDKGLRTHLRRVHHMTDEEVYALGVLNVD